VGDGLTGPDFFISYASENREWAEWIAVQLERAGFATVYQAADFRPGRDFVHEMQRAVVTARRTIAVLSPAYLGSRFGEAEWRAAFARDPTGEQGLLIPVRVQPCEPLGLLTSRVYVDLVGVDEEVACRRLLAATAADPPRPAAAPFPGVRFPGASPGAEQAGGHVFISYVRADTDRVFRLRRHLESAGLPVWIDVNNLWPGQDWRLEIATAIKSGSLVFLACFSHHTASRATSYQNEEITLAVDQMRLRPQGTPWLIPVRFDDCRLPRFDLGAGRTLDSIQRVDLLGEAWQDNIGRLLTTLRSLLGRDAPPPEASASRPSTAESLLSELPRTRWRAYRKDDVERWAYAVDNPAWDSAPLPGHLALVPRFGTAFGGYRRDEVDAFARTFVQVSPDQLMRPAADGGQSAYATALLDILSRTPDARTAMDAAGLEQLRERCRVPESDRVVAAVQAGAGWIVVTDWGFRFHSRRSALAVRHSDLDGVAVSVFKSWSDVGDFSAIRSDLCVRFRGELLSIGGAPVDVDRHVAICRALSRINCLNAGARGIACSGEKRFWISDVDPWERRTRIPLHDGDHP
jgi:hypothetical protein